MENVIEYIVGMKDNLSPAIKGATEHVNHLESSIGHVKGIVGELGSALGIGFAVFKGIEFVKESVEKFHELEQVTAKVEANLKSTGEVAGLSMEELKKMAGDLSSHVQASRVEIMDMQSQLLTFPAITKDVFGQSMGLVTDIAKQTGHGLSETAIMYGKALNDPIDGLQKMMRYGVMFTESEKQKISQLQISGHLIDAQKAMMDAIAGSGYAGVATAMFNADPLAKFNKTMGSLKMIVGEVAMEILTTLSPALVGIANIFKSTFEFMKDYGAYIMVVVGAYVAYKGALIATVFWQGLQERIALQQALANMGNTGATIALTTAQGLQAIVAAGLTGVMETLNVVLLANPIMLIVVGVAALIMGIIALVHHFGSFKAMFQNVWLMMKEGISSMIEYWKSLGEMIIGVLMAPFDKGKMFKKGLADLEDSTIGAAKRIGKIWSEGSAANYIEKETAIAKKIKELRETHKMSDTALDNSTKKLLTELNKGEEKGILSASEKSKIMSLLPKKGEKTGKDGNNVTYEGKIPSTKGEAAKAVNIHIAYNAPLIKEFTISTSTIKEGLDDLKEKISAILVGVTHDSLLIADY